MTTTKLPSKAQAEAIGSAAHVHKVWRRMACFAPSVKACVNRGWIEQEGHSTDYDYYRPTDSGRAALAAYQERNPKP